ncbi:hypothetical protein Cob_v007130 [Colletotrichum orbiculare MAFF 240422]|uniref:Secreted protein n=1 Tax=Colletotrichum orbiculare (strain 104-T / ATCC 96160 / CBS 514.97 / LARS 414 / MAFF 240422) TaxID=1213857 RepID=A0A484FQG4_COLOR|nr:hypothetical protein Cob_v007130 [Colletotrichum orbiculare MAFF 240422]
MQITQITKLFALALLSVGVSADQEGPLSCWHTMDGCNNHCNSVGTLELMRRQEFFDIFYWSFLPQSWTPVFLLDST